MLSPESLLFASGQSLGLAFVKFTEVIAHQIAQLAGDGIADETNGAESLLAGADHARIPQDGKVLGNVGLTGGEFLHQLTHGLFLGHNERQNPQAHGFTESAESPCNQV